MLCSLCIYIYFVYNSKIQVFCFVVFPLISVCMGGVARLLEEVISSLSPAQYLELQLGHDRGFNTEVTG